MEKQVASFFVCGDAFRGGEGDWKKRLASLLTWAIFGGINWIPCFGDRCGIRGMVGQMDLDRGLSFCDGVFDSSDRSGIRESCF